jgi:hypothetical protein
MNGKHHEGINVRDDCRLFPLPTARKKTGENMELLPPCPDGFRASQQTSCDTPPSEGEDSFVEGWKDHESSHTLETENETLFTNMCDDLSRQLADTYTAAVLIGHGKIRKEVGGHHSCAGSDSSAIVSQTSSHTGSSWQTTAPSSELPISPKRGGDNDEDEDPNGDQRGKRQRAGPSAASMSDGKLLACPFFKYDPARYSECNVVEKSYRGCSSCFLKDISRVKQHLYRVHRRPDHYCGRCSEVFNSQDALDTHTRALDVCDVRDPQFSEKMTADQLTSIKRRSPGRSPRDTWYIIFKVLFPGAVLPDTPFAEWTSPDTIAAFIGHAERHGPALLSALVSSDIQHLPFYKQHDRQILEEAIERAFPQVIRELSRNFSQSSSQSDISSSRSAIPSSPIAGGGERGMASSGEPGSSQSPDIIAVSAEPAQSRSDSRPNLPSPIASPGAQVLSGTAELGAQNLAPPASDTTDFWPPFPVHESQYFDQEFQPHVDVQAFFALGEQYDPGDNIYPASTGTGHTRCSRLGQCGNETI